jgi:hypothetical protein
MTEQEWLTAADPTSMLEFLAGKASDRKLRLCACACVRLVWHLLADEASRRAVDVAERYAEGLADDAERGQAAEAAGAVLARAKETAQASRQAMVAARRASYGVEGPAKVDARAAWANAAARWREAQALECTAQAAHDLLRRRTEKEQRWAELHPGQSDFPQEERTVPLHAMGQAEMALRHTVEAEAVRTNWEAAGLTPLSWGILEDRWETTLAGWNRERCVLLRCIFGNPFRPATLDDSWLRWNGGIVVQIAESINDERSFGSLPVLADALEEAGCHEADILSHCRHEGPHALGCWVVDLLRGKK